MTYICSECDSSLLYQIADGWPLWKLNQYTLTQISSHLRSNKTSKDVYTVGMVFLSMANKPLRGGLKKLFSYLAYPVADLGPLNVR